MYVRLLQQEEIRQACAMAWKAFRANVASSCSAEGRVAFQAYIQYEYIADSWFRGETMLLGCFQGPQMRGTAGLTRNGHIGFLFADPRASGTGVEHYLMQEISKIAVHQLNIHKLTVNVPPPMIKIYQDLGFRQVTTQQLSDGVSFIPMELVLDKLQTPIPKPYHDNRDFRIQERTTNNTSAVLITILAICGAGVFLLGGFVILSVIRYRTHQVVEQVESELFEYDPFENEHHDPVGRSDIDERTLYIGSDITYTVEENNYYLFEEIGTIFLYFDVNFPVVTGLEGGIEVEINQTLRDVAMETVNDIYLNPSEDMIESTLNMQDPYFSSFVTYTITYMDEHFMSVVFEDMYSLGDYAFYWELRTVNINLTSGVVYSIDDVITMDDAFIEIWLERMRQQAPHTVILDEIPSSEFLNILEGNNDAFREALMVTGNGIEIGFSYRQGNAVGWVMAPFTIDEIILYQSDSEFWELIHLEY